MMIARMIVSIAGLLVPRTQRPRWREEWLAEVRHGGPRMLTGVLADTRAMRKSLRPSAGRRASLFAGLGHDIRYGLRRLRASPGFVVGAVLSLSLGIGGNIVAFSFMNAAVFRPFPGVRDQHELARVSIEARRDDSRGVETFIRASGMTADAGLDLIRKSLTTLSGLSAHYEADLVIASDGPPFTGPGGAIVVMITRQALTPALLGAAVGLFVAALAGKVVSSSLYAAGSTDLRAFAGSTALLLGVLFVATIVPARRAAGINPVDTLRTE